MGILRDCRPAVRCRLASVVCLGSVGGVWVKYVYLVAEPWHGYPPYYWKIGVSAKPNGRVLEHQISNPRHLVTRALSNNMSTGHAILVEKLLLDGALYPGIGTLDLQPVRAEGEWMRSYHLAHMEWAMGVLTEMSDPWV